MIVFTHDKERYSLGDFKQVAIWGAGDLGQSLSKELLEKRILTRFYLDGKPQSKNCHGVPIYLLQDVPSKSWDEIECIFFAFLSHREAVRKAISEAGVTIPIFNYPNDYIYNPEAYFDFNKSKTDIQLLNFLQDYLSDVPKPLSIYGNQKFCNYLFDVCPNLKEQMDCLFDDDVKSGHDTFHGVEVFPTEDGKRDVQTVFLAETDRDRLMAMTDRVKDWDVNLISLELIEQKVPELIPKRAICEKHELEYPVVIPDIMVQPGLDVLLLEPPGRLMPIILPNGLGIVHNILNQPDIKLQSIDCNIILYHRFHKKRLANGGINPFSGDYQIKEDPWERESWEEWTNPAFVEQFNPAIKEIVDGIVSARPKIVGISLNMINRLFAKAIVTDIRNRLDDVIIVVGGPDCQYHEFGPMKFDMFDYMVINAAEPSLLQLIQRIKTGEKVKDCPGIVSRYDSETWEWEPSDEILDLDNYGFPKYPWTTLDTYSNYNGYINSAPISTNRGCKWGRCRFCTECLPYHGRSPQKVVDEIEWLAERNYNMISLNDSDANSDSDKLLAVCREIVRRNLNVSLYGQFRIDRKNTPEFFQTLKQAGFGSIVFGVDGWSDNLLKLQRKGYTMATVDQNLKDCRDAGIQASVNMVIGVPGETDDDIKDIVKNVIRNRAHMVIGQVTLFSLAAGSEYYNNPEKYGIKFNGDKKEIYARCMDTNIDPELWYSTSPYIDLSIRMQRLKNLYRKLREKGVVFDYFCRELIKNTLEKEEK